MKKLYRLLSITIFIFIIAALFYGCAPRKTQETFITPNNIAMKLTSSEFEHNKPIPSKYSCDGNDVNPPLQISEVPEEAESLALIMDDPDAPAGTWDHWLLWNIDPKTTEISADSVPTSAVQGQNSWGRSDYGGPCPPTGAHRYVFKLYALDTTLKLGSHANKAELQTAMKDHILDQAELIGMYSR